MRNRFWSTVSIVEKYFYLPVMTNFIPLFPLAIVVYPGEKLNLHIFEPRYLQMVNDCLEQKKPFGLQVVIDNVPSEWGTLLHVTEVSKKYESGAMDIKTVGDTIFKILEPIHELPDKMYKGAIVTYPVNLQRGKESLKEKVIEKTQELHELLKVEKRLPVDISQINSYTLAHHIGLKADEEFAILTYLDELHRLEYLNRHLTKVIAVLKEMELLKEKIKLNGHFKHISGYEAK